MFSYVFVILFNSVVNGRAFDLIRDLIQNIQKNISIVIHYFLSKKYILQLFEFVKTEFVDSWFRFFNIKMIENHSLRSKM